MAVFPIAKEGRALCRIDCGDPDFTVAAEALDQYLAKITGAEGFSLPAPRTIAFRKAPRGLNGFAYRVEGDTLILEAETAMTAQYAVYDLLERLAGCRFYTSKVEKIPHQADLALDVEDYEADPILQFRELYYRDYGDSVFAAKRKMHPFEQHAGWGFWCHSFNKLMPARDYFDEHPEYFAMIDGKRDPQGQLCLSNPEVLEIVVERLAGFMAQQPDKLYWSVSQDDHDRYCRCPACQALDEIDGGPMGSLLNFVNKVAERFPDKIISTLAYWYSRKAPKVTRPASNVHIMLCNIEALRGEPLTDDPRNEGTVQELKDWAAICDQVFLWDYNIQFANLVSPFPNLNTLGPNMRFFVENSVRSLFSQCNREIGGEMAELRGYMLSKLMWDPYTDARAVMEDFVQGYFGPAAPHIQHYIDTLHAASHASGAPLGIFHGPANARESYLTPELVEGYAADFDAAEAAAAGDPEVLERVRIARLPLIYAQLMLKYGSRQQRLNLTSSFARSARDQGLEKVEEWHITVDQFVTDTLASLGHDRLEFSRQRLPAMSLLGVMDPKPEENRSAVSVFASYQHRLNEVGAYLELPAVSHNYIFYSLAKAGGRFVGLKMRAAAPKGTPSSFERIDIPAAECVTLRFEAEDREAALAAVPAYLAEHQLLQKGDIVDKETMAGIHTLYIPV